MVLALGQHGVRLGGGAGQGIFHLPVRPGIAMSLGRKKCQVGLTLFLVSSPWSENVSGKLPFSSRAAQYVYILVLFFWGWCVTLKGIMGRRYF